MYCPQCGGANEESAKFCSTCGLDLDKYRQQWQDSDSSAGGQAALQAGEPAADQPAEGAIGQQPATYQQPAAQPPPYPQQYQQYQAPQYYQSTPPHGTVPRVPSYMGWAIATLILCFWPTGIVAVVYASQVGSKLSVGDIGGAQESSHKAKIWCWVTFGIGVAGIVIAIIVTLLVAAAAVTVY
jgi:hypothetical protein